MSLLSDLIPVLAILLLCLSAWLTINVIERGEYKTSIVAFLIINIIFIFSVLIIFIFYLLVMPWIYWALIISGVLIGFVSYLKKFVPGQVLSMGLLLYTGFVALFSIGIILIGLFTIQLFSSILNYNRYGLIHSE